MQPQGNCVAGLLLNDSTTDKRIHSSAALTRGNFGGISTVPTECFETADAGTVFPSPITLRNLTKPISGRSFHCLGQLNSLPINPRAAGLALVCNVVVLVCCPIQPS